MAKVKRPRIFVDADNTLLKTFVCAPDWLADKLGRVHHVTGIPPLEHNSPSGRKGDIRASVARPSAHSFLLELSQLGRVEILTYSSTKHQVPVLETLGLRKLVQEVWGKDNIHQMPPTRRTRWVLVDDEWPDEPRTEKKFKWLGYAQQDSIAKWNHIVKTRFVKCVGWQGGILDSVPDPFALTDLLPVIAKQLERQRHRRREER